MPAVKSASPLDDKLAKRGFAAAVAANKDNEIDYGFGGDLPAGINGGVALLTEIKTGEYKSGDKRGEPFIRLAGVVKSPSVYNDCRIEGLQASIMIPLCDDPPNPRRGNKPGKTYNDRIAQLLNEFKKMGAEEAVKQLPANATFSHLMVIADALVKAAPHFAFRTYAITDKPTPQNPHPAPGNTQTDFKGIVSYNSNGQSLPAVQDNSGSNGETNSAPEPEEAVDWTGVGATADNGDADSQARIEAAIEQYGLGEQCATITYEESAALIAQAEAGGGGEAPTDAETEAPAADSGIPEVGQTWSYKPKGARKAVEAQVTVVFEASKKVNLKLLGGSEAGKVVRSVPWEELQ